MDPNNAIHSLFRQFGQDCEQLKANEREMQKLADGYFRYRNLLREQGKIRSRIIKIFGVLGVYSPDVLKETARLISPIKDINSSEVRDGLKPRIWEVLELFLSAVDGPASLSEFKAFLFELDFPVPTSQAIDSAVKAHPEIFKEQLEGGEKFLELRR